VRKVNIDTDIRLAMTGALRRSLSRNPAELDVRRFLKDATAAASELCRTRFEAFGSAGWASRIRPVRLDEMASRYAAGEGAAGRDRVPQIAPPPAADAAHPA
jgi:fructose-bisphosphate aldolase class II